MKFVVTHYARQSPEDNWVILPFVSRRLGEVDGPFFFGFDTLQEFTSQTIAEKEAVGSLKRLARPFFLGSNQALWLTPESDVFIASRGDPLGDVQRILVATDISPLDNSGPEAVLRRNWVRQGILSRKPAPRLVIVDEGYLQKPAFNELTKRDIAQLKTRSGALASVSLPRGKLRWEILPSLVASGVFDFCRDPYFKTQERGESIEVVQFGWLKTFKCVVNIRADGLPVGLLNATQQPFEVTLVNFLQQAPDIEVGVLGETAAAMEVMHALKSLPNLLTRVNTRQDSFFLRHWLDSEPESRIAVVDHAVAAEIEDMTVEGLEKRVPLPPMKSSIHGAPRCSSEGRVFLYRKPMPVGFMFPRSCMAWGADVQAAFADGIVELGDQLHWDRADGGAQSIEAELSTIGVEAFPFSEICRQLGLLEYYYSRIREHLGQALTNCDDAKAKTLQVELTTLEQELRQ